MLGRLTAPMVCVFAVRIEELAFLPVDTSKASVAIASLAV